MLRCGLATIVAVAFADVDIDADTFCTSAAAAAAIHAPLTAAEPPLDVNIAAALENMVI